MKKMILNASFFAFFIAYSPTKAQSLVEWNDGVKLNYENFKKKPTQTKIPQGFLDLRLGWQIAEAEGSIPELFVRNRINEDESWISMKNHEILQEMQLKFDLAELYARKIRKEFEALRQKKETSKDIYKNKFIVIQKNFEKRLKKVSNVTLSQPDLYKLLNKEIQDSLIIYKSYSKK